MSSLEEEQLDDKKYKRNYKACLNCRTRKVKCDLGSVDDPHPPCARCKRERKECVFAESRRGGSLPGSKKKRKSASETEDDIIKRSKTTTPTPPLPSISEAEGLFHQNMPGQPSILSYSVPVPVNPGPIQTSIPPISTSPNQHTLQKPSLPQRSQIHQQNASLHQPVPLVSNHSETRANSVTTPGEDTFPVPPPVPKSSEFATMQGALVFLARAAGTIAKADDRDKINAREIHEQLESHESESSSNLDSPQIQNSTVPIPGTNSTDYDLPLIRPHGRKPVSLPPVEKSSTVHPNPSKTLADIPYIGQDKMLTEKEAIHLIELFFLTMHPFFPYIPEQLHEPQVLAGYPILLCAILTISSRYHPFESDKSLVVNKNSRNIQLHERLWVYCQRLISQTIWAEASTRSIGTALAFLLFTEWNPRAIHWRWSDYANNPEFRDDMGPDGPGGVEEAEDGEGLAGLSAMRRSDRMAWMLVGTSVRLSQDMGFITGVPEIFVATHVAETNTAMSLGQRSMLSQSLGEVDLDKEDDDDPVTDRSKFQHDQFILSLDEETMRRRSLQKRSLKFTFSQKAKLELLKIMSLAYETIYCGTYHQLDQLNGQNLTILSVLSPLIENWYKTYKKLLKPSNPKNFNHHCNLKNANNPKHVHEITKQIDKESLISDYYYCQLYIYSLALSMENPLNSNVSNAKKPLNNIRLDEISKASKFVELAYNAAKEILNAATRVHKLKMLKYMPVRWVTRVVRSVAFIVKCFLTLTNANKQTGTQNSPNQQTSTILTLSIIPTDDILSTIQKSAIVLREASPDELHLCTRYSTILMYLCSEMKYRSKLSAIPPKPTKLDISDDEEDEPQQLSESQNPSPKESNGSNPNLQGQNSQQSFFQSQSFTNVNQVYETGYVPTNNNNSSSSSGFSTGFSYQQMGRNNNGVQPLPDSIIDWFMKNDEAIGLDFVEPWTEMLEQHLGKNKNNIEQ